MNLKKEKLTFKKARSMWLLHTGMMSYNSQHNLAMVEYFIVIHFSRFFSKLTLQRVGGTNFITALFYYFNMSPSVKWETIS